MDLGRQKSLQSAGICQNCVTTPWVIKKDLSVSESLGGRKLETMPAFTYSTADGTFQMLLELCTVQEMEGIAENATLFKPQGYATSEDRIKSGSSWESSGSDRVASLRPAGQTCLTSVLLGTGLLVIIAHLV